MTETADAPGVIVRRPRRSGTEASAGSAPGAEVRIGGGASVRPTGSRAGADHLGYEPALDGLRAVAVTAVLLYHARFSWIPGGFLGVSTFFTLSGFLITSLMLQEWRHQGGISLRRFFSRRFHRLLPASWMTLNLVLVMGALGIWTTDQLRTLRGDVPWSLAELVNWHFIFEGRSYGAQFTAPSPLEHFWSLAVEQQFYLVLPLAVVALLGFSQRRRRARAVGGDGEQATAASTASTPTGPRLWPLVSVLVVAAAVSITLNGLFAGTDIPRSYFGTDTRLAELVAGALLACVGLTRIRRGSRNRRLLLQLLALGGLAAMVVLWNQATVASSWMYPWGFVVTALASTTLIVGALQRGWVASLLSLAPVVALGRISYGVYLLHWPIFVWLTPARTGLGQWPLFGVRMAVTLAAAVVMFRILETPIRSGGWLRTVADRVAVPMVVFIVAFTLVVTNGLPAPSQLAAAEDTAPSAPAGPAPVHVMVVGDELASSWDPSAGGGAALTGTKKVPLRVTVSDAPGCGVALGGYVRLSDGNVERDTDRCGPVKDLWKAAVAREHPDVVVVWSALRDVADRRIDLEHPWSAPGSPDLDDFLTTEVRQLVDDLGSTGAAVVLATVPHMRNATPPTPSPPQILPPDPTRADLIAAYNAQSRVGVPPPGFAENEDARIDHWNQILTTVAHDRGVTLLDSAADMAAWPGGQFDPKRRAADGVGVTEVGMRTLSTAAAPELKAARATAATPDSSAVPVAAQAPLPDPPPLTPRRTVAPGMTADVLVVGDSVAFNVGVGLTDWAKAGGEAEIQAAGKFGCPVARGGQFRFLRDINTFEDRCEWTDTWSRYLADRNHQVVVLASGIWEVVDRRLPGDDRFRHIGQPEIDHYLLREFLAAIDLLGSRGASVVLLTYPHFQAGRDQGYTDLPESDPARVDRLNEILRQAASLRPGVATVIDFQGWLASQPGGEDDPAKREDGLHFYDAYAPTIGAWLGPQLMAIAQQGVPAPPAPPG